MVVCCHPCAQPQMNATLTVSSYVEMFLGHKYSERWLFTLSTFLLGVGFRILAMFALRYISHLKR